MNNIKIVFIDLDGTLTNKNQIVSEKNIEALKLLKDKNIKIVITTGRWDSYVYNLIDLSLIDYIISNNGACIIDTKSNKVIYENSFSKEDIDTINSYCISNNYNLIYNGLFKRYNINDKIDGNIYQGVIICDSIDKMDKLIEFTNNTNNLKLAYISYAYYKKIIKNEYTANINLKETNKGTTIKYLLNQLNLSKENSLCFGDNNNDINMFEQCGTKVAMENSLDELKEKADYITLDNNNDGIYYFIKKYFNK